MTAGKAPEGFERGTVKAVQSTPCQGSPCGGPRPSGKAIQAAEPARPTKERRTRHGAWRERRPGRQTLGGGGERAAFSLGPPGKDEALRRGRRRGQGRAVFSPRQGSALTLLPPPRRNLERRARHWAAPEAERIAAESHRAAVAAQGDGVESRPRCQAGTPLPDSALRAGNGCGSCGISHPLGAGGRSLA
jgi:hypothetical protein